jgi:ABC-2 type transport system ATP-binding protein
MKNEPVLEVKNVIKTYGDYTAVDDISFSIQKGEVLGFLGPNGAGKTTTIQMLLGITKLNSGKICYFGKDFSKNREYCLQRINFTSAYNNLQGKITVMENFNVYARLYGVKNHKKKITELTEYFEISHLLNKIFWNLSASFCDIVPTGSPTEISPKHLTLYSSHLRV